LKGAALRWGLILAAMAAVVPAIGQPTAFLIGDSTVRNGQGDGAGRLWGWGDFLGSRFATNQLRVVNRALGGRSSRTFLTEGRWDKVRAELTPGDFVLMQFGHNDGGEMFTGDRPRASLKGNSEDTREGTVEATGKAETVHSYGWYLRRYIADARAAGALPVVLSPIPRHMWKDGKVIRANTTYGQWAADAARQAGVAFVDLNELIARRYEALGEAKVREYFTASDHTHTTREGAIANAECVVAGLRGVREIPVEKVLTEPVLVAGRTGFQFTSGFAKSGWARVTPDTLFTRERGYGFDLGSKMTEPRGGNALVVGDAPDALPAGPATGDQPFFFSVLLPEGNYVVTAVLGDRAASSTNIVKAESRRLMLEQVVAGPGQLETRRFTVNVRTPELPGGERVRLKDREKDYLHWDDKLTLEFSGTHPCLSSLRLDRPTAAVTVYLLGDSTVTDQPHEPWNSWGQMLPRFFLPNVAVANHAESGESLKSSLAARRCDKVFSTLQPGDYVFAQFGHNDMKDKSPGALAGYKAELERLVEKTRACGATPVLLTSMERKAGVDKVTLGDYPQTVRDVAQAKGVALIDLHVMSRALYRALGTNLGAAFVDGTHHNSFGSYELARCVVEGIRRNKLALAKYIPQEIPPFDPAQPDAPEKMSVPASPRRDAAAPDGN